MKRKIFCSILIGCLVMSFVACGKEETGTTASEQEPVVSEEIGITEDIVEDVIEEVVPEVWSDKVSDTFKPAFDAHPILQGEVIAGGTYEDMVAHIGEANVPSETDYMHYYSHTNSNGASFISNFDYLEGADTHVRRMFASSNDIVEAYEYFMCDNEYYAITTETYDTMVKYKTDGVFYDTFKTYEDVVNVMGVPGYITDVNALITVADIEEITIIWVVPPTDGDMSYIEFDFDANGKVLSHTFW